MTGRILLCMLAFLALAAITYGASDPVWIPLDGVSESRPIVASITSGTPEDVILDVEVAGFTAARVSTDRGPFTRVDLPGCGRTVEIGKALLPVFRQMIEVPQGSTPQVEILQVNTRSFRLPEMALPTMVYPAQAPVEKVPGALEEAEFAFLEGFYTSHTVYPGYQARIAETGQIRGHRFATLEIAPVRYAPDEGVIEVIDFIRLRVSNPGADLAATQAVIDRYASPPFEQAASKVLLNYQAPSAEALTAPLGYLIVAAPWFLDEIAPFAAWKSANGYATTVTSTSDIPGGATTGAIQAYIQDAYDNWSSPPTFVLLVGDVADIPNWTGVGADNPPTDLYYSTLTPGDYIPDVGLGRFSMGIDAQVATLVQKTINYEKRFFEEGCWFKNAVFMASEDNYSITEGTHNYVISNYLDPAGFTCDKLYTHTYSATTQQVSDAFNAGRGLGVYSGHGGTGSWADGPPFSQADVNALTNLDMYPFVQSYACLTGRYTEVECFGETWIRAADKGALAFWGSSVGSYWEEDDVLEKSVFRALFADDLREIWGMTLIGKVYLYLHYSGGGDTQRYFEMYNTLGDPTVEIWIANQPPVAQCRPYEADADEDCCISVSASDVDNGSYDPDAVEDIASLLITGIDGEPVAPGQQVDVCGQGPHTVTLTVTDRCGESDWCDADVEVLNQPPVAVCKPCVGEADENCCIRVTVDSLDAGSFDPDGPGDIESFCITALDGVPVGCQEEVEICGVGTYPVTMTITDWCGETDNCEAAVEVIDVTPPEISVTLDRYVLWPPNHKMVDISSSIEVWDNCDPDPVVALVSITSSEPDDTLGDGHHEPDIQGADFGTPDSTFSLRAERMGLKLGRIYTIVYTATDFSGNVATSTVYVRVPHNQPGMAFASYGFNEEGTGFTGETEEFVLVIPSRRAVYGMDQEGNTVLVEEHFDAGQLDVSKTRVGNTSGALFPVGSTTLDQDGDGLLDIAVRYSAAEARPLVDEIVEARCGEVWVAENLNPVGLHYVSASGVDYLVYDIFSLGPPVEIAGGGGSAGITDELPETDPVPVTPLHTPDETMLYPVKPNPFTGTAMIRFALARQEYVSLHIYDARGVIMDTIEDGVLSAGIHQRSWDARVKSVAPGVYFVRFSAGTYRATEKVMVLR
jgi:hypothetical protein